MIKDLWQYLKETKRPIVFYGTGNGGDKIMDELLRLGIEVQGIFASQGFVRNRTFRGIPVESYERIIERFGDDIIILLVFGSSLPDVMNRFFDLADKHEFYAPDVPIAGENIFNASFYETHRGEMDRLRSLLADETSVKLFDDIIAYRLSGKIDRLQGNTTDEDTVFETLLHPARYRRALDLGAFNGDTAHALLRRCPHMEAVYAWEPDARNFRKLSESSNGTKIIPCHLAAWDSKTTLTFTTGGGRGITNKETKKTVEVSADAPDRRLGNEPIDYIKIDVEGAEKEALAGCRAIIERYHPDISLSLYHRSEDIFTLPLSLHQIDPAYRLYLRRFPYIPAWDFNLIATRRG